MPPKLPSRLSCEVVTITAHLERVGKATTGKWGDPRRGTRAERGYGPAWDRLRLAILVRDSYLCQCADCKGGALRVTVAREVDHIISKARWLRERGTLAGVDDPSNLQAIGRECHRRKTAAESGRPLRPRVGPDGYPIEG